MNGKLKIAINNLYDVFAKYHGNPNMKGSPLYSDLEGWNKAIFFKPIHQLTSQDLSRFAGKVISTWGDINDLKYFLPRLFELTAQLDTPYEVWILYQKLEDGNFQTWETIEQNAVNECSIAMWDCLLNDNSEKAEFEFADYFSTLARFYPNFNDLTESWMENNSFSSIKHLTNYIISDVQYLFQKNYIRGNEKSTKNIIEFKNWLLSDKLIQKLTNAFYQFETTELAERISWTIKILEDRK